MNDRVKLELLYLHFFCLHFQSATLGDMSIHVLTSSQSPELLL